MKKIVFLHLVVLLLSVTVMFCGCSAEKGSSGAFVVGLEAGFPPMEFKDEKGEIVGFDVDLAKETAKRLGYVLKIREIAWDNRDAELKSGNIDCIWSSFSITEERAKTILFTPPYLENSLVLIFRESSGYNTLEDMKGKRIGAQAGSSGQDTFEADPVLGAAPTRLIKYHDVPTAFMDLTAGAIDAIFIDAVVANYHMSQNTGATLKTLVYPGAKELYGVGFRPEDGELRNKVANTLNAMDADGTAAKISKKWFGVNLSIIGRE